MMPLVPKWVWVPGLIGGLCCSTNQLVCISVGRFSTWPHSWMIMLPDHRCFILHLSPLIGWYLWHGEEDTKVQSLQTPWRFDYTQRADNSWYNSLWCHVYNPVTALWPAYQFWKCSRDGPGDHMQCKGKLCTFCLCNSYVKSIKNFEPQARGANDGSFHIAGADQLHPTDFRHAWRSPNLKIALIKILMQEWKDNNYAPIIK